MEHVFTESMFLVGFVIFIAAILVLDMLVIDLRQIIRQAVMRRIFAMNQGITDILDSLDFGTTRRAVFDPNRVFRFIRFWPFGSLYMGKATYENESAQLLA